MHDATYRRRLQQESLGCFGDAGRLEDIGGLSGRYDSNSLRIHANGRFRFELPKLALNRNGKPAGESFDLDLIDMSLPAENAYRGVLPYRLSPEEKDKYWGKVERKNIQTAGTTLGCGIP